MYRVFDINTGLTVIRTEREKTAIDKQLENPELWSLAKPNQNIVKVYQQNIYHAVD